MNVTSQPQGPESENGLATAARLVIRYYKMILGATIGMGVAAGLLVLLLVPRTYESSATLVLVSPKVSSDLKATGLTVQGYQRLMESDAVIEETRQRLIAKGHWQGHETLRLKEDLETRIFVARYSETTTLAPMLQVVAKSTTPDRAAAAANTWAEVFLVWVGNLMAGSTGSQVKFVEEEYPKSQARLKQLEEEQLAVAKDFRRQLDELVKTWGAKILAFKNETSRLTSQQQSETKLLTEEFMGSNNISTRRGQLQAFRKAYFELQVAQAQVNSQLQEKTILLEASRKHLSQVSAYISLRKAITDEALWRSLIGAEGKELDWKQLQDRSLVSQELNPVYKELSGRVAQLEVDERALAPRYKQLEEELARISASIKSLDVSLRTDEAKLEKLTREREAGLEQLQDLRTTELEDLTRDRQRYVDALASEKDTRLAQIDRSVTQEKELNAVLSKNYNQALLAKAQQALEDVRLGAPAVKVDRSMSRGVVPAALVGAMLGTVLGIAYAFVKNALQAARPSPAA